MTESLSGSKSPIAPEWEGGFVFERRAWARGFAQVAGVDEVGRGPLAGPVLAAAVILPPDACLPGLKDSKLLTARQREALVPLIHAASLAWNIALVDVDYIDRHNIARAAFQAMRLAVEGLAVPPDFLLVDGFRIPGLAHPQEAIVGGDRLSNAVAAASVLAKVERDRLMDEYGLVYPGYGFELHKGYPTPAHREAIRQLGTCPIHRLSFKLL